MLIQNEGLFSFISSQFNENTIDNQIRQQEELISKAQQKIDTLTSLKDYQTQLPWYKWNDVTFQLHEYDSDNSYCDTDCGITVFKSYEEFASEILKVLFPHLTKRERFGSFTKIFEIISPTGELYSLDFGLNELPLVKEFIERDDLRKVIKKFDDQIEKLELKEKGLKLIIEEKDKYNESYIENQKKELSRCELEIINIQDERNNSPEAKRIDELNQVLLASNLFEEWK